MSDFLNESYKRRGGDPHILKKLIAGGLSLAAATAFLSSRDDAKPFDPNTDVSSPFGDSAKRAMNYYEKNPYGEELKEMENYKLVSNRRLDPNNFDHQMFASHLKIVHRTNIEQDEFVSKHNVAPDEKIDLGHNYAYSINSLAKIFRTHPKKLNDIFLDKVHKDNNSPLKTFMANPFDHPIPDKEEWNHVGLPHPFQRSVLNESVSKNQPRGTSPMTGKDVYQTSTPPKKKDPNKKAFEDTKKSLNQKVYESLGVRINEIRYEENLKDSEPRIVTGIQGVKGKPFFKKFKNANHMDSFFDHPDNQGNYKIHQVERLDEGNLGKALGAIALSGLALAGGKAVHDKNLKDKAAQEEFMNYSKKENPQGQYAFGNKDSDYDNWGSGGAAPIQESLMGDYPPEAKETLDRSEMHPKGTEEHHLLKSLFHDQMAVHYDKMTSPRAGERSTYHLIKAEEHAYLADIARKRWDSQQSLDEAWGSNSMTPIELATLNYEIAGEEPEENHRYNNAKAHYHANMADHYRDNPTKGSVDLIKSHEEAANHYFKKCGLAESYGVMPNDSFTQMSRTLNAPVSTPFKDKIKNRYQPKQWPYAPDNTPYLFDMNDENPRSLDLPYPANSNMMSESEEELGWDEHKGFGREWDLHVPLSGEGNNPHAEAVRAVGRLEHDYYNNGYVNAFEYKGGIDPYYKEMHQSLIGYLRATNGPVDSANELLSRKHYDSFDHEDSFQYNMKAVKDHLVKVGKNKEASVYPKRNYNLEPKKNSWTSRVWDKEPETGESPNFNLTLKEENKGWR